jgi:hypothetical protein
MRWQTSRGWIYFYTRLAYHCLGRLQPWKRIAGRCFQGGSVRSAEGSVEAENLGIGCLRNGNANESGGD